ncbi:MULTISPECIES: hypothetical protein [Pseudomonas]|uniref:hypothetical protein n=1 Tax=Pseudomonas TaxID=286 RepID=UPI0018A94FFC|nr:MULTISPECIES: hypothetical protein [Pseudomonas]MBF8744551.1 hypothetical protein [Pseudomonas monteilii]
MKIILDRKGAIDVAQAVDNFVGNSLKSCPLIGSYRTHRHPSRACQVPKSSIPFIMCVQFSTERTVTA